jgi:Protein of unknown function (DUF3040)
MALSMDEQRMLAEIERRLAAEDPGLAARLSAFRRPSRVNVFRTARARVIGSLLTVAVVAMVSLMVYAILPFRSGSRTPGHAVTTVSSTGTGQPEIGVGPGTKPAGKPASTTAPAPAQSAAAKSAAARAASASMVGGTVQQSSSSHPSSPSSAAVHQADGSP